MLAKAHGRVRPARADRYHAERNHQGLESRLIEPGPELGRAEGRVLCRSRLGGLLRYYYREAA